MLVLDQRTRRLFPFLETIFADSAYGGPKLAKAMAGAAWKIEVVKKSPRIKRVSRFCPDAGSWSAPSPGSIVAGACRRILKTSTAQPLHSSALHPLGLCSGGWCAIVFLHKLLGRTLRDSASACAKLTLYASASAAELSDDSFMETIPTAKPAANMIAPSATWLTRSFRAYPVVTHTHYI